MSQALSNSSQVVANQIQVTHPIKGMFNGTFSYTAETTIKDLHQWIEDSEGIPFEQHVLLLFFLNPCVVIEKKSSM